MKVLEKILEEIKERIEKLNMADNMCRENAERNRNFEGVKYFQSLMFATERAESIIGDIIRSHMDEVKDTNVPSNWIPVEERLPEAGELVRVTVHSSEWISDYNSDWVSEEDKIHYPAEYNVYDGFLCRDEAWIFYDKYNAEVTCVKEFGIDKGRVYDVATAWMPIILPETYKGGKENE